MNSLAVALKAAVHSRRGNLRQICRRSDIGRVAMREAQCFRRMARGFNFASLGARQPFMGSCVEFFLPKIIEVQRKFKDVTWGR